MTWPRAPDYLREHLTVPSLVIGHSLGGAAELAIPQQVGPPLGELPDPVGESDQILPLSARTPINASTQLLSCSRRTLSWIPSPPEVHVVHLGQ